MIRKITHHTDYLLTQEKAMQPLKKMAIEVIWYTNRSNTESVLHRHPYYVEMVLPVSGEVLYSVEGSLYKLRTGEMIFFPVDLYHSGKYNFGDGPAASERIVVQIDSALWEEAVVFAGLEKATWLHELTVMDADAVAYWDMRHLFERMSYTTEMHPHHKHTVFLGQTAELLCIMDQVVRRQLVGAPSATSRQVARAVEYIQSHYQDPKLSVAQLCEATYTSRGYLSRIFKEYTMESIYSYITLLRMQHCRQTLAEKDISVLEACIESGFPDYTSFLKSFRRLYGISPSQYKKQLSQNKADTGDGAEGEPEDGTGADNDGGEASAL